VLRWFNYEIHGKLRNADDLDANGFFIGNHHFELDEQFELLRSALNELTLLASK
jgi:CDP-6-deoxy-D-xylo-4-hexulose-3-dehydrase